jgi:putative transcriptional regulator
MSDASTMDELLAAHAAGHLPAALALIVATHLALSPESRRRYRCFEAAGGVLLDRIEPVPLAHGAWERLVARLDAEEDAKPARAPAVSWPGIPRPLRDHLPASPDAVPWRRLPNARAIDLDLGETGFRTSLISVDAGRAFPRHGHAGRELILTLEGGFRDESGHYRRGDLQIAGAGEEHQPVADEGQDWLWLRVLDAPLRPVGEFAGLHDL